MAIITLLVSVIIAALLVVIALSLFTRSTRTGDGEAAAPIERGRSVQCLSQRRRAETFLQLYRAEHGSFPRSLDDLADVAAEEFVCPVTGISYRYDTDAGKLVCPDHPR